MARAPMVLTGVLFLALAFAAGWAVPATSYVDCDPDRASCTSARVLNALRASLPSLRHASLAAAFFAFGIALMRYPPRAFRLLAAMLSGGVVTYASGEFVRRFAGSAPGSAPDARLAWLADPLTAGAALLLVGTLVLAFVLQARAPQAARPPSA